MSSEEYEVERIVDHKILKDNKKKLSIKYLIKWLNYDEEDNTWEKAKNVFAVDLIEAYWDAIPDNHPDKITWKKLTLPSQKSKGREEAKKPRVIENMSDVDHDTTVLTTEPTEEATEAPLEDAAVQDEIETTPQIDVTVKERMGSPEKRVLDETDLLRETKRARNEVTCTEVAQLEEEEEEEEVPVRPKKIRLFINGGNSSASSQYSPENSGKSSSSSSSEEEEERKEEDIIFDETFGSDREDWQKMASKIEYIGREVEGSPLFCLLKWNDGIRSMHPLQVIREKCPQLVIDAFIDIVSESK
ncbi:hypothetical protein G6F43_007941 [Rhizopus delemar]|nr:hypothetical protein G6F43_007941 [Rhizopus delemar]